MKLEKAQARVSSWIPEGLDLVSVWVTLGAPDDRQHVKRRVAREQRRVLIMLWEQVLADKQAPGKDPVDHAQDVWQFLFPGSRVGRLTRHGSMG